MEEEKEEREEGLKFWSKMRNQEIPRCWLTHLRPTSWHQGVKEEEEEGEEEVKKEELLLRVQGRVSS